jgi:DnaJ-class molecular chaperone
MTIAKKCPECDEDGWRYDSLGFRWTCPECGGRGEILDGQDDPYNDISHAEAIRMKVEDENEHTI